MFTLYTISRSAKNSNWVNLNITKPVRSSDDCTRRLCVFGY